MKKEKTQIVLIPIVDTSDKGICAIGKLHNEKFKTFRYKNTGAETKKDLGKLFQSDVGSNIKILKKKRIFSYKKDGKTYNIYAVKISGNANVQENNTIQGVGLYPLCENGKKERKQVKRISKPLDEKIFSLCKDHYEKFSSYCAETSLDEEGSKKILVIDYETQIKPFDKRLDSVFKSSKHNSHIA